MSIRDFELFHGAVLAKLVRSDRPITLRMVETKASTDWSTYTLNDELNLFVAHSKSPRVYSRGDGGHAWQFVFSQNQMRQIGSPGNGKPVWLALVCAGSECTVAVCLLDPDQMAAVIDTAASSQNLTIRKPNGRSWFRVMKRQTAIFKVPQNRLDNWDIPGS